MNRSISLSEKDVSRFWSKVKIGGPDECWEWQAGKSEKGYGTFQLKNGNFFAHRISWVLSFGEIPNDYCVCHKCDNPACVNQKHFFLGTYDDNNKDRARKGRSADVSGENNPSAKLKVGDVVLIKNMTEQGKSQRKIARMFGVGKSTVARIQQGTHWKDVENG